jgi:uncharacterized membrane protein YhhN
MCTKHSLPYLSVLSICNQCTSLSSYLRFIFSIQTTDPLYFIGGLFFFLIAHICYCFAFKEVQPVDKDEKKSSWLKDTCYAQTMHIPPNVGGAIVTFLVGLLSIVLPKVKHDDGSPDYILRIAVAVYGSVISIMLAMSINRFNAKRDSNATIAPSGHSKTCAVIGALIFMSSDCVIAINRFVTPVKHGKIIVMVTYYLGQFLIARSAYFAKPIDVFIQKSKKN